VEPDVTRGWTTWLGAPWRTLARRRTIGAIVISTLVHATLLTACALWIFSPRGAGPTLAIRTEWNETARPELTPLEPLPVAAQPDEDDAGGTSQGLAVFHHAEGLAGDVLALEEPALSVLETSGHLATPTADTPTVGLSGGQGQGEVAGQGRGGGSGAGEGSAEGGAFFGLTAEGRRVVYVVDCSRSMNHPHPGPMKTRFGRVKLELVRSIGAMSPEQEFFIVYFNDQAWPMPAPTMKLAIPSAQQKYLRWAVEAKAGGKTDPEQALLMALSLQPDVVYFLTDGAFKPRVVERVRAANQRLQIAIHTIGFGDDEGEPLLQAIATQNGGTYQFIPDEPTGPDGQTTENVSVESP
jgi:hypothetical protein